ncbi:hypothetical protein BU15DRAFT_71419 [Melanogaster broomeanus]|nr:hypothetical protein BU15DRAFT_71419 [Melanogaster broomeanus]
MPRDRVHEVQQFGIAANYNPVELLRVSDGDAYAKGSLYLDGALYQLHRMQNLQGNSKQNLRKDIARAQDRYDQQLLEQEEIEVEIRSVRWYSLTKKIKLSRRKVEFCGENRRLYELAQVNHLSVHLNICIYMGFNLTEGFKFAELESCVLPAVTFGDQDISFDEPVIGIVTDDSMTQADVVSLVETIYGNLDSPDNPFRDPVDPVVSIADSSEGGLPDTARASSSSVITSGPDTPSQASAKREHFRGSSPSPSVIVIKDSVFATRSQVVGTTWIKGRRNSGASVKIK